MCCLEVYCLISKYLGIFQLSLSAIDFQFDSFLVWEQA